MSNNNELIVLEESGHDGEWRIGYVAGKPAVGDSAGRWYHVPEETIVPQTSKKLVWMLQDDEWSCLHTMHWNADITPATSPDVWLKNGAVYAEKRA